MAGLGESELDGICFRFNSDLSLISHERKIYCISDFLHHCCTVHGVAEFEFANHQLIPKMYPTDRAFFWGDSGPDGHSVCVCLCFCVIQDCQMIFPFPGFLFPFLATPLAGECRCRASSCAISVHVDSCQERSLQCFHAKLAWPGRCELEARDQCGIIFCKPAIQSELMVRCCFKLAAHYIIRSLRPLSGMLRSGLHFVAIWTSCRVGLMHRSFGKCL